MKYFFRDIALFVLPIILVILVIALSKPIAQHAAYHDLADNRTMFGLVGGGDIITSLMFGLVGLAGLFIIVMLKPEFKNEGERYGYLLFFASFIALGYCSTYYHSKPDNLSLVIDRLPIVSALCAIGFAVLSERFSMRIGLLTYLVSLLFGFYATWYWISSELVGLGDIRYYAAFQFLISSIILLSVIFKKSAYNFSIIFFLVFAIFVITRLPEIFDQELFQWTNQIVSGHSIRHASISVCVLLIITYLLRRQKIDAVL